jgi:uncharacterized protein YjiS (DUF1127 family)
LFPRIRPSQRARHGIADLRALDDHVLADIGLTRGQIEYVAHFGKLPRALE